MHPEMPIWGNKRVLRLYAILLESIRGISIFISEMLSSFSPIFNVRWLKILTFIVLALELVNEIMIFHETCPSSATGRILLQSKS